MKTEIKTNNTLYPLPAVLVSCGANSEEHNIISISWTGTINSEPPMCSISVRKERHSYDIIKKNGEFVINLTDEALTFATDWCGVKSGRNYDKFKEMKLTKIPGKYVNVPMIAEAPVNIECKVMQIIDLGSHDIFIAKVVGVHASNHYVNSDTGALSMSHMDLITYVKGYYYGLGKQLGRSGFSVGKKK